MRKFTVTVNGQDYDVVVKDGGAAVAAPAAAPAPAAAAPAAVAAGETSVDSPMPGKITSIAKKVGDAVSEGDEVMVLEAMKMGNPIMAPCSGTIKSIAVQVGLSVQGGDQLFVIG